jgi:L-lactate permease
MWQQNYTPVGDNLLASAFVAALPIFTILILLGVLRRPAWLAAVSALVFILYYSITQSPAYFNLPKWNGFGVGVDLSRS